MSAINSAPVGDDMNDWFQIDIERILDSYEQAWQENPPAKLRDFLPPEDAPYRHDVAEELVKIDLEYRWRLRAGAAINETMSQRSSSLFFTLIPLRLEDYLAEFPFLRPSPDMIAEEYRARSKWGDRPEIGQYLSRFPEFAAELPDLLWLVHSEVQVERSQSAGRLAAAGRQESTFSNAEILTLQPASDASGSSVVLPLADLPPKQIGRYLVETLLGRGAFGAVYLAYDPQLQRKVAIKVPHKHVTEQNDLFSTLREARLAARLQHPGVVRLYDVVSDGDVCYVVSEYIEGRSLREAQRDKPPAPPPPPP